MIDEYMKAASFIVCSLCDEKKCVGRYNCRDILGWIEMKKKIEKEGDTD